jgi:hypothetical protein
MINKKSSERKRHLLQIYILSVSKKKCRLGFNKQVLEEVVYRW